MTNKVYAVRSGLICGKRFYTCGNGLNAITFDPNKADHIALPCGPAGVTLRINDETICIMTKIIYRVPVIVRERASARLKELIARVRDRL